MKRVLLLFLTLSTLFLTSCNKNEELTTNPKDALLGKWKISSINRSEIKQLDECVAKSSVEFLESEFISKEYGKKEDCILREYKYDYTIEGNKIIFKGGEEEMYYKISNNKLTIKASKGVYVYSK